MLLRLEIKLTQLECIMPLLWDDELLILAIVLVVVVVLLIIWAIIYCINKGHDR